MSAKLPAIVCGLVFLVGAARVLPADQLELQNGDRLSGHVVSVSADAVVLENEVLGKVTVPRKKVVSLAFGTNSVARVAAGELPRLTVPTNLPAAAALIDVAKTNGGTNDVMRQVREQLLAGSPAAASKFDAMAAGLMSGKLSLNDLRREAKSSVAQLQELKRELGADADDSLDGYLEVLNSFLQETPAAPTNAPNQRPGR